MKWLGGLFAVLAVGLVLSARHADAAAEGVDHQAADWVSRFGFSPPTAGTEGLCPPGGAGLPTFTVVPAAVGRQLVRISLPFAPGTYPADLGLVVRADGQQIAPDVRVLTYHPGRPRFVRRAIVTFLFSFPDSAARSFETALTTCPAGRVGPSTRPGGLEEHIGGLTLKLGEASLEVGGPNGAAWRAELIAPARQWSVAPTVEVIERGEHYLWVRLLVPDALWPRIVELRADGLGTVALRASVQRLESGDGYAPDLGWRISGPAVRSVQWGNVERVLAGGSIRHAFAQGEPIRIVAGSRRLAFPDAALLRRGQVEVRPVGDGSEITYLRCRAAEHVPHQEAAWREATVLIGPSDAVPWNALLEPPHQLGVPAESFDALYHSGVSADLRPWDALDAIRRYHREAIVGSALRGDDFGNVTTFPAAVFGMNRLNHCPPIFEEYYRSGDARLRETALQWCANYHDLCIWWGAGRPGEFGGTRYNNASRHSDAHRNDLGFMWRSNTAVTFCTKGYDSFFYAYEETGDPRMATCLRWQVEYARQAVHADRGECRNIGDVLDFLRLYRFTGCGGYLDEALRLFRELRTRLSTGDLFDQGGKPIANDPPFIEDDAAGLKIGYAKPYIIGYALQGLPGLLHYAPDEPKLRDVVRAVARFLAESQDPVGGWRYPHPLSATVSVGQAMEHANQLVNAARAFEACGEPIDELLDAVERVLQARILVWHKSGKLFTGLGGWEQAAGLLRGGRRLGDLYRRPGDRPRERDYTEGAVSTGGVPPEGLVYFSQVLDFYLAHRPAERLFNANPQLQNVLNRVPAEATTRAIPSPSTRYARYGMADKLPTFAAAQKGRLTFPLACDPVGGLPFARWRAAARKTLLDALMTPPPRAAFDPALLASEDRGTYEARKLVFNISADCRVPAYLLVPKGGGPFPAIVALHDHGAHFSIGKEKVVRPFGERPEILADAQDWTAKYYGGRFIGDELAARGYVVFAADALFWGDRGRREGFEYAAQQELAANLMQLGMTWVGVITWDDIRSAEFVAAQPEVDPTRIGAIGLSMGGHRTWMLCAASDRVAAGAAICWMATTASLMVPGNNQTGGQSAFSMLIPGISNHLDIPDIASIACPKPMLFYNGEQDMLFPIPGVRDAYARMRRVWDGQAAGERLETKLWSVPHVFTREMQDEAFAWLGRQLAGTRRRDDSR